MHRFDQNDKVTVAQAGVWPERLEEIWEAICAHRKVGFGALGVAILEFDTVDAVDGKAASVRSVEAGGADDGINRAVAPIGGCNACGIDMRNASRDHVHLR